MNVPQQHNKTQFIRLLVQTLMTRLPVGGIKSAAGDTFEEEILAKNGGQRMSIPSQGHPLLYPWQTHNSLHKAHYPIIKMRRGGVSWSHTFISTIYGLK